MHHRGPLYIGRGSAEARRASLGFWDTLFTHPYILRITRIFSNPCIEDFQCVQCETPLLAFPVFLLSLAQRSTPLHFLAVARRCSHLLLYFCQAGAELLLLPCSEHWCALMRRPSRTGWRTASFAVNLSTPQAGIMCRKCFLMQERSKRLQILCLHNLSFSSWHEPAPSSPLSWKFK